MAQGLNKFKTKKSEHRRDSLNDAHSTHRPLLSSSVFCVYVFMNNFQKLNHNHFFFTFIDSTIFITSSDFGVQYSTSKMH